MSSLAAAAGCGGSSYYGSQRQRVGNAQEGTVHGGEATSRSSRPSSESGLDDEHGPTETIASSHHSEGEKWLHEEAEKAKNSYLNKGAQYQPFQCSGKNGAVPTTHLQKAIKEYKRRFFGASTSSPSVVLVATGVNKEWSVPKDVGCARFLLFPQLGATRQSALFITYMPGPEHGAIDNWFAGMLSRWKYANQVLVSHLSGGLSSGGYGQFQPDARVFPYKKNRDHAGRDSDRGNKQNPYSRFIWEVEYGNRDPVEIRERGRMYLTPHYTRLFLAVKLYEPSTNGAYQAAAVLWGKAEGQNDTVTIMRAVSFGTEDLSDDHKHEFFQRRADRLVGIDVNQWDRPTPQLVESSWLLTVPYRGFLFKVSKGKPEEGRETRYVLDDLGGDAVDDLVIDLRGLVAEYENQVLYED
jgi:hypothetical protein